MKEFIEKLPKAELHLHIEGSLEPATMFQFAQRNNIALPYKNIEEVKKAYQFKDLQSFLDIYYKGAEVLCHEKDFYDLAWEYLSRMAKENVRHVEIFFDPQTHTARGISFKTVITALSRALQDAKEKLKISSRLIMCFLKHLSEDAAIQTLQDALPYKNQIYGVGLDSSELGNPPEKFEKVMNMALKEGFITVAHAGEEGPADYIWSSIQKLNISRIDHGVRCTDDPKLVEYLRRSRLPLTVCPLSNIKLCVFDKISDHNLKTLLDKGLCAMINSDDPAYFGGYMNQNYQAVQEGLNLSIQELAQLAKNSFEASFLSISEKQTYYQEIDELVRRFS